MPNTLPVTDVMSTEVLTFTRDTSVEDAVAGLTAKGYTGAPVVDDDGRLVGLLDDSDLILSESRVHAPSAIEILGAYIPIPSSVDRFREEVQHALARTVGELMDTDPPSVPTTGTVEDVATIMLDRHVSRVPVVDADGRVVGLVSRGDLVAAIGRRR
jgi:CBS domain-containing protein